MLGRTPAALEHCVATTVLLWLFINLRLKASPALSLVTGLIGPDIVEASARGLG